MASTLWDFVRIIPLVFLGSKVGQYPQELLDEVYKVSQCYGGEFYRKSCASRLPIEDVSEVWFGQRRAIGW